MEILNIKKDNIIALNWFIDHKGYIMQLPSDPIMTNHGEFRLHTRAKGIFKPRWSKFALSIKILIDSPYNDQLKDKENDNWTLLYNQEGDDEDFWTNTSLKRNMYQGFPVGVLFQVNEDPSLYKIFGLGKVLDYNDGKFSIESL